MATIHRVWTGLVSEWRGGRVGSLWRWTLGLGGAVGVDVGGSRTVGLRSLPLWTVGIYRLAVGVGTRARRRGPRLRPRAGRVCGRPGFSHRVQLWQYRGSCVVSAGAFRTVLSLVPLRWKL